MAWMLFMDESGHDRKVVPFEIRGGILVEDVQLWPLLSDLQKAQERIFGRQLADVGKEIKGSSLLKSERMKLLKIDDKGVLTAAFSHQERQSLCLSLFVKNLNKESGSFLERKAYAEACFLFVEAILESLYDRWAHVFASAIPRDLRDDGQGARDGYLRKDHVYLFERLHNFIQELQNPSTAFIMMDRCEDAYDVDFVRRMESYFTKTNNGRDRAKSIIPYPFFVDSKISHPIQIADVVLYLMNWAYRMDVLNSLEVRTELSWLASKIKPLIWSAKEGGAQKSLVLIKKPYSFTPSG